MCFWSFGRVCHSHSFELVLVQVWERRTGMGESASLYTDGKVNLKEKTEPGGIVGKSLSDTAPTPIYWEKCWSWAYESSFYHFKSSYKKISHLLFHLFHITVLGHKRVGIMSFMWNFLKVAQLQGVRGMLLKPPCESGSPGVFKEGHCLDLHWGIWFCLSWVQPKHQYFSKGPHWF